MPSINRRTASRFCELCNWAYEAWVTHKCLFDANPESETNVDLSPWFTDRLSTITQEYALLQIAKLHDPWKQGSSVNLTIDYMVKCGDWGIHKPIVHDIAERLEVLNAKIRPARNRTLSHNDLNTVIENTSLGGFPEGDDEKYFVALQELADTVHDRWVGGPFPFNDLAMADAHEFLNILKRGSPNRLQKR